MRGGEVGQAGKSGASGRNRLAVKTGHFGQVGQKGFCSGTNSSGADGASVGGPRLHAHCTASSAVQVSSRKIGEIL